MCDFGCGGRGGIVVRSWDVGVGVRFSGRFFGYGCKEGRFEEAEIS